MIAEMKKSVFQYNDRMKRFILGILLKVDYLRDIEQDAIHDILYNLKTERFSRGHILQKPGDNADTLFFLVDGVIEIYTTIEDADEFVIERLFRGSVINYRTFCMPDDGKVFYRFGRNSICATLHFDKFEEIYMKHPSLKKKFTKFRRSIITEDKPFPLDYIMNLPKHLRNEKVDLKTQN